MHAISGLDQSGANNIIGILQNGHSNMYSVTQSGIDNKISISQHGSYNTAKDIQSGSSNTIVREQNGVGIQGGTIEQYGYGLSIVITGGAGAKYLGIGGSTEYRRDIVTVYLSAVSVSTGEVVLSTNSSKTIYFASISGGAFKFVSFDRLLEVESGITVNEPPQLAVRQAIEMSVYSLIMEGWKKGLWSFKNKVQGNAAYQQYLHYTNQKKQRSKLRLSRKSVRSPHSIESMLVCKPLARKLHERVVRSGEIE